MILPNSYEMILDKIKQDWFMAGYEAAEEEAKTHQYHQFKSLGDDIKMDFSDVLIQPQYSLVNSRKDVGLTKDFTFLHSSQTWTGIVPIISSNMTSITTPKVAQKMSDRGMMSCLPKNRDDQFLGIDNIIPSIGLGDDVENIKSKAICLDLPTAYLDAAISKTREIREAHPDIVLIVGNICTKKGIAPLLKAGADICKIGIGSGGCCATRLVSGIGYPQLSAIMECSREAHRLGGLIISDGGCVCPGDVVKALCFADMVMLGSMLGGHDENGSSIWGGSSIRGNVEMTGEMADYRTSEGWEVELEPRGPIDATLQDILGGLRSAGSYIGARSIEEFPQRAEFIRVNNQANQSLWENRI